jgi:pimeloyl-ACP methyl ester carboxylesterase
MNVQNRILCMGFIVATMFGANLDEANLQASAIKGSPINRIAVVSVSPVLLPAPGRGEDLQIRVSAPTSGRKLPVIIFAHGNGMSSNDYAPLVNFWAAHGFVVIQPTFLDSKTIGVHPDDPRTPIIWRFRVDDIKRILDQLAILESSVPGLKGRVDRSRIAAVGHSYGGQTTAMLLGARIIGSDGRKEDMSDGRIKVGILLSTAGNGGKDLSAFAAKNFPFMNPSFTEMTKPALIIAGDKDFSRLTVRGPDWFADPYVLSQGEKCLATLFGAEHMLGGISGEGAVAATEENSARVAEVQRLTLAFLQSSLYPGNPAWPGARAALTDTPHPIVRIECK